jgi:hypothetical protein
MLVMTMPFCLAVQAVSHDDLTVLGIPYNAQKSDVINSLGQPSEEGVLKVDICATYYIAYGGVKFKLTTAEDEGIITTIIISNRDAVTTRGLAVGDDESKILSVYGNSYMLVNNRREKEYRFIWGTPNTCDVHGINFVCAQGKIARIIIWT